ncbi:MAG: PepSY domain-containing protein [Nitrospirae bacterium]|nr:PepSY domain-containing protein [Nitrospirota bacterium]
MVNKAVFTGLLTTIIILLVHTCLYAGDGARGQSVSCDTCIFADSRAFADDGRYPYGGSKRGKYGEKNIVTEEEAQGIVKEYFPNKEFRIGKFKRKKHYFEAEILDKHGKAVDRVIIDQRTGRIRSVY